MATQKPISTVSYNTVSFLKEKLDSMYRSHLIQAYQFICHKGEDGDKDHTHVRIEPNKRIDPMDIQAELTEYVYGEAKPRGVRPFRPSKEEDWFLYAVHDPVYLKWKNQDDPHEKIPYDWHSIVVSDGYDLEIAVIRAQAYLKHSSANLASRISQGEAPSQLIFQGENPYVVNAITHALSSNDYLRLAHDYKILSDRFNSLCSVVSSLGYTIDLLEDNQINLIKDSD